MPVPEAVLAAHREIMMVVGRHITVMAATTVEVTAERVGVEVVIIGVGEVVVTVVEVAVIGAEEAAAVAASGGEVVDTVEAAGEREASGESIPISICIQTPSSAVHT